MTDHLCTGLCVNAVASEHVDKSRGTGHPPKILGKHTQPRVDLYCPSYQPDWTADQKPTSAASGQAVFCRTCEPTAAHAHSMSSLVTVTELVYGQICEGGKLWRWPRRVLQYSNYNNNGQ